MLLRLNEFSRVGAGRLPRSPWTAALRALQMTGSGCSHPGFLSNVFAWAWRHVTTPYMPRVLGQRFKAKMTFILCKKVQLRQPSLTTC